MEIGFPSIALRRFTSIYCQQGYVASSNKPILQSNKGISQKWLLLFIYEITLPLRKDNKLKQNNDLPESGGPQNTMQFFSVSLSKMV